MVEDQAGHCVRGGVRIICVDDPMPPSRLRHELEQPGSARGIVGRWVLAAFDLRGARKVAGIRRGEPMALFCPRTRRGGLRIRWHGQAQETARFSAPILPAFYSLGFTSSRSLQPALSETWENRYSPKFQDRWSRATEIRDPCIPPCLQNGRQHIRRSGSHAVSDPLMPLAHHAAMPRPLTAGKPQCM